MMNDKNKEVLGWLYHCLVLGTPAIIILALVFGLTKYQWCMDFIANAFWWGLGLIMLLALFGFDPFSGNKK